MVKNNERMDLKTREDRTYRSLLRERHGGKGMEKISQSVGHLGDMSLPERRRQASEPLYLLRYE